MDVCSATLKSGKPCTNKAKNNGLCGIHSPKTLESSTPGFSPPTFSFDGNWQQFLEEEGYAVIQGVLPPNVQKELQQQFVKDLQQVSPGLNFEDPSTLNIQHLPCMYGKGMAVFSGFGQCEGMWKLRLRPEILRISAKIHNTEELVVSLDGFSVFVSKDQKPQSWLHRDQNPENKTYSIQGAYNFLPVTETSAGFVCVPKSHKLPPPTTKKTGDLVLYEGKEKAVKLIIPDNCCVLWNSRTVHANTGMTTSRKGLNRLTAYITFFPKNLRSEEVRKQKIQAYINGDTTSHWGNRCEIKKYPFGFQKHYEGRGYGRIKTDPNIPESILRYL